MNRLYVVACKVLGVEGQNAADTIYIHRRPTSFASWTLSPITLCWTTRRCTPNRLRANPAGPSGIARFSPSQPKRAQLRIRGRCSPARPRCHIPELGHILECEIHRITGGEQSGDTLDR